MKRQCSTMRVLLLFLTLISSSIAFQRSPTLISSSSRATTTTTPTRVVTFFSNKRSAASLIARHRSQRDFTNIRLSSSSSSDNNDIYFDGKTTAALVGGQSALVLVAVLLGTLFGVPNKGLGPNIAFTIDALKSGFIYTIPLFALAAALDVIEARVPALQDVTKATQRSVLSLLGGTFKPLLGLTTATILGIAAGFGEEMLFRGILQYELAQRIGGSPAVAIGASSLLFGALHAVTPMYAALATLASVYFGYMYTASGNLAVPILCHALYDVGALLYAHWTVTRLQATEQEAIAKWGGPTAGPL